MRALVRALVPVPVDVVVVDEVLLELLQLLLRPMLMREVVQVLPRPTASPRSDRRPLAAKQERRPSVPVPVALAQRERRPRLSVGASNLRLVLVVQLLLLPVVMLPSARLFHLRQLVKVLKR